VFERFTEQARQAVVAAQWEARGLGHDYIGTEHILLGLLTVEDGLAAEVLASLGVGLDEARRRVVEVVGAGDRAPTGQIPFTPSTKKVLELSLRKALGLGHNYIGTEHILLGLAREEGTATRILLDFDVDETKVREAVIAKLELSPASSRPRPRAAYARPAWFGAGSWRPHWEYRVERPATIEHAWLNELGGEGWELVAIAGDTLVFKRRRPAPGEFRAAD
jgi:ATP-dependent Clp protease ATP-binding subunit ClpC